MSNNNRWLLPEGIDEVLPPQAAQLEDLCRKIIDLYTSWGYELVMPPLIEYLDSLLTGTGEDLDLQTFKITDQLTGKTMGIRADTTPQVARIDAHNLKRETPTRLCYLGTVLHSRPGAHGGTRAPFQTGAELYGHGSVESEAEIVSLMLKTMKMASVYNVHVDLGHVGIYRGLTRGLDITEEQGALLFDVLQRKAAAELKNVIDECGLDRDRADMLFALIELNGELSVLDEARKVLRKAGDDVLVCIDELERVAELTQVRIKNAPLYVDLSELRGYNYYTGIAFATYVPGQGQGIAFGGRYDDIGKAFGAKARPATGFSTDIKMLYSLSSTKEEKTMGIFAPASLLPGLYEAIDGLRAQGEIVVCELPEQSGSASDMNCDRMLYLDGGNWKVKRI